MIGYVVRRLLYGVLILLGVNLFTFILFFAVNTPDDMARLAIGGQRVSADAVEKWKIERGYDKPLFLNVKQEGTKKYTETIFYQRSVPLLTFDFGSSDEGRDIGREIKARMWPSLALAVPSFVLGLALSIVFSLVLVFFRTTALDFWGVVVCVVMLSISSLFYIIAGQWLFSKILRLVPYSGFAGGWDTLKFLALPMYIMVFASSKYRYTPGSSGRLLRMDFGSKEIIDSKIRIKLCFSNNSIIGLLNALGEIL